MFKLPSWRVAFFYTGPIYPPLTNKKSTHPALGVHTHTLMSGAPMLSG